MPLQTSGAMSTADINLELDRSSTSSINTGETAMTDMAGSSAYAIPNDLYGKSRLGTLFGTINVTIGTKSGASYFGYSGSFTDPTGSASPTSYRGRSIYSILSWTSSGVWPFSIALSGSGLSASLITGVEVVGSGFYEAVNDSSMGGSTPSWYFGNLGDGGTSNPWNGSNVGQTKTVKIYGAP